MPLSGLKFGHPERRQLAVSRACHKGGLCHGAEIGITGIEQSLGLGNRQVSHARGVGFFERLDAAPSVIGPDLTFAPCAIEGCLQDRQDSICA